MIPLALGILLAGISIYYFNRNNILIPSILLTFVHLFIIWGVYQLTGNIAYGFLAMVIYTFYFGFETVRFVIRNKDIQDVEAKLKRLVDEEFEFFSRALKEDVDEDEFFRHVLKFDEIYDIASRYDCMHVVKPLKDFLKHYLPLLRRYNVSRKAKKLGIPKQRWWFYMDEIVLDR